MKRGKAAEKYVGKIQGEINKEIKTKEKRINKNADK
jgi:hypothetical protein